MPVHSPDIVSRQRRGFLRLSAAGLPPRPPSSRLPLWPCHEQHQRTAGRPARPAKLHDNGAQVRGRLAPVPRLLAAHVTVAVVFIRRSGRRCSSKKRPIRRRLAAEGHIRVVKRSRRQVNLQRGTRHRAARLNRHPGEALPHRWVVAFAFNRAAQIHRPARLLRVVAAAGNRPGPGRHRPPPPAARLPATPYSHAGASPATRKFTAVFQHHNHLVPTRSSVAFTHPARPACGPPAGR